MNRETWVKLAAVVAYLTIAVYAVLTLDGVAIVTTFVLGAVIVWIVVHDAEDFFSV